jgi:hypothetical protein
LGREGFSHSVWRRGRIKKGSLRSSQPHFSRGHIYPFKAAARRTQLSLLASATKLSPAPHGPPMTLGNMRELGVQRLIACCLNDGIETLNDFYAPQVKQRSSAERVLAL